MNVQEATKLISDKLEQAQKLYAECAALADEYGVQFRYDNVDGSGGNYIPRSKEGLDWVSSGCEWESSDTDYENDSRLGWVSSSANC